jgi:hypothetical protein
MNAKYEAPTRPTPSGPTPSCSAGRRASAPCRRS